MNQEEMLWILLGRRAAGLFPRNQSGADLVIPIFRGSEVSLILVQVKNVAGHDSGFPKSATVKMHPSYVFSSENSLSKRLPSEVIRVYMSLREVRFVRHEYVEMRVEDDKDDPNKKNPKKRTKELKRSTSTEPDTTTTTTPAQTYNAFTLCIRSVRPWFLEKHNSMEWPTVPDAEDVVIRLGEMAAPLWDPIALARGDFDHRNAIGTVTSSVKRLSSVMPDRKLLGIAQKALLYDKLGGSALEVEEKPAAPRSNKRKR